MCCKIDSYYYFHSTTICPYLGEDLYNCALGTLTHHHRLGCTSPMTPRMTSHHELYIYQNFNDWKVKVTPITHSHLDNDLCCKIDSCYYFHSISFHPHLGEDLYNCVLGTVTHHHRLGCTSPMTPRMTSHH